MHLVQRIAASMLAAATLAACSPPKPPDEERRPEPQAHAGEQRPQSIGESPHTASIGAATSASPT